MGRTMYGLQLSFQIILISLIGQLGSAGRPMVTFKPEWNKIFFSQSIRMTCNVEPPALSYHWYHNNTEISTRSKYYDIQYAELEHSGDYKCRTSTGDTSEIVTLRVIYGISDPMEGSLILQAPLYTYEGDNVYLRCLSLFEMTAIEPKFYRNNQAIPISTSGYNPLLRINYTDLTATYSCSKRLLIVNTYSAETTISYTENVRTIQVTFIPDWNKLLTGENITMTCHGGNNLTYQWFQNDIVVAEGQNYTITSAQVGHSGIYQCRTSHGDSLPFRLEVSNGPLVLQAPFFVFRGRNMPLNCHCRPEYFIHRTLYFKDNSRLYKPFDDLYYVVPYGSSDASGRYRCEQILSRNEYVMRMDEVSLHVRDLFSKPVITTKPYPVAEGDNVTLLCDTSLTPLRQGTELQFAFYRDGQEVQKFSSSHQYEVQSAQLNDSVNYSCAVRAPTKSGIKISKEFYIQIQGPNSDNGTSTPDIALIVPLVLFFLITISLIIIVVYKYRRIASLTSTKTTLDPPDAESSRGLSQEGDACCSKVNITQKAFSKPEQKHEDDQVQPLMSLPVLEDGSQ